MPAEFLESRSVGAALVVGYPPFGEIVYFRVPAAARNGEPVGTSTMVKNTGDLHGNFYISLWDASTGAKLFQSGKVGIGPGAQADFSFTGAGGPTMPNRDLELLVQTHHNGEYDDLVQKRVPLLAEIATALSISIEPPIVARGESYLQKGRLTRTDTGAGLGGEKIFFYRNDVLLPGSDETDGEGYYSLSIVAPTDVGTYSCYSRFLSRVELGYAGAVSDTVAFTIPPFPELAWWQWGLLVAWGIIGGVGVALGRKKR